MDQHEQQDVNDDDIGRLLRAAGARKHLPDDMKGRWEQQFRAELAPVLQRRARSRRNWVLGLCASIALAVGVVALTRLPTTPSPLAIRVSHVSGERQMMLPGGDLQLVQVGQALPAGSSIVTGAKGLVALAYGAYDLRLNHQTQVVLAPDHIALQRGELYASDRGRVPQGQQLRIDTAYGTVRDIGTQFTVASYPDRTVTTVRRGAVLVNTGLAEVRAEPEPGQASRLVVNRELQLKRETVPPNGPGWNWIYAGGSDFSLEGKTVHEFLQWSVGESGLALQFDSAQAETRARTTWLHGDIGGLDPEQAVDPVLATTDLVAEPGEGNVLWVRLRPQG